MFAAPVVPLPTSADGTDLGLHVAPSELSPSLHGDHAPHPISIATPDSSTVVLDKAALGAIPPALAAQKDSAIRQIDSGPQAPSTVSCSASRVAGSNRAQLPEAPGAPPLLPSPSQTALPSFLPSGLILSRICRRRAAAAGKPQATVEYDFDRSDPTPPTVPQPAPTARKPRPPRSASPSQVFPGPSIEPVPTVSIQHATDATTSVPPLLGALPSEASQRFSTPAALPEMLSPAEVELIVSVEPCSTPIRRVSNAPNRFVTPPSGMFFLEVPRFSPTISSSTWRLTKSAFFTR